VLAQLHVSKPDQKMFIWGKTVIPKLLKETDI
jgi:hypothetical protein